MSTQAPIPTLHLTATPPIRLIAVDMDGTLLNEESRVPPRTLAAIAAAEAAGIHFVIATGRRHSYAMRVLRPLSLTPENILITSNGAVVRTVAATHIETTHLPFSTTQWLLQQLGEYRNALVLTFDRLAPDGDDARGALVVEHLEDLHQSIDKWMQANAPYIAHVIPIEQALTPEDPPIQAMLCGTVARMRKAEALLLQDPRVAPVGRTSQNPPSKSSSPAPSTPTATFPSSTFSPPNAPRVPPSSALPTPWESKPQTSWPSATTGTTSPCSKSSATPS